MSESQSEITNNEGRGKDRRPSTSSNEGEKKKSRHSSTSSASEGKKIHRRSSASSDDESKRKSRHSSGSSIGERTKKEASSSTSSLDDDKKKDRLSDETPNVQISNSEEPVSTLDEKLSDSWVMSVESDDRRQDVSIITPAPSVDPQDVGVVGLALPEKTPSHQGHFAVVAIDLGTTYSGYACSLTSDPDRMFMMRAWDGGDLGVINEKTPTCLLLTPDLAFHSFGFTARNTYHDLEPDDAQAWIYFEKFKMRLHFEAVSIIDYLVCILCG